MHKDDFLFVYHFDHFLGSCFYLFYKGTNPQNGTLLNYFPGTVFNYYLHVIWDETIAIEGKVGEYLVLARRKGDTWYLAAMNGWTAINKEISLSFLPEGNYTLEEMRDGANSSIVAAEYSHKTSSVRSTDKVTVQLAPGGGYAAIIRSLRK